jgi:hypothetical protein
LLALQAQAQQQLSLGQPFANGFPSQMIGQQPSMFLQPNLISRGSFFQPTNPSTNGTPMGVGFIPMMNNAQFAPFAPSQLAQVVSTTPNIQSAQVTPETIQGQNNASSSIAGLNMLSELLMKQATTQQQQAQAGTDLQQSLAQSMGLSTISPELPLQQLQQQAIQEALLQQRLAQAAAAAAANQQQPGGMMFGMTPTGISPLFSQQQLSQAQALLNQLAQIQQESQQQQQGQAQPASPAIPLKNSPHENT